MAIWKVAPLRFAPAFRALGVCEHTWPFSLGDIWATLLSPKWVEVFVAQMAGDEMSLTLSSSTPLPLGAAQIPILLSEVEQEQRPSGNEDREAIVVGAGLCDGEGERAYTRYAPHILRNVSANHFSLRRFGIFFLPKSPLPCFCLNVFCRNVRNSPK